MRTNYIKYKNLILYLCQKLGGSIHGRKKLFKLLYYVDFDMFEYKESRKTVTGTKYYAWKMGPVPEKEVFEKIISDMQQDGSITDAKEDTAPGYHPTEVITAKKDPNYSVFNDDEIFIINKVIEKYGKLSGTQLEQLTHNEAPWCATEHNAEIPFELALYRGTAF